MPSTARPSLSPAALPGLLLSLLVGAGAVLAGSALPALSPALGAIVLGAAAANLGLLGARLRPGLDLAAAQVLRAGIVLLGLQLALGDVLGLGPATLAVIVGVVAGGIGAGLLVGRALGLPRSLTVLISCGFSICGAAAVAAVAGSLAPGEEREQLRARTATAVALVVVVGTLMIPTLPLAASLLGLAPGTAGVWAGASILEVAQVVAAGSLVGPQALDAAVVVKLGRVLLLAPVIAVLALSLRAPSEAGARPGRPLPVPLFVVGFGLAVLLRTSGIVPVPVLDAARGLQSVLLAAAMFALGTGVRAALLRQVGGRPVVLAASLAVIVTGLGLLGALLAG